MQTTPTMQNNWDYQVAETSFGKPYIIAGDIL